MHEASAAVTVAEEVLAAARMQVVADSAAQVEALPAVAVSAERAEALPEALGSALAIRDRADTAA